MIKNNIIKLYELISTMILLLERDLEIAEEEDKDLKMKKSIATISSKLVTILIQLNKFKNSENQTLDLPSKDMEIIERFMSNYKKKK